METSFVQSIKLAIVSTLGLSRDALHVYAGLAVFLGVAIAFRKPMRSFIPWLAALFVAVGVEALDAFDDMRAFGHWRTGASLRDIVNTVFWPTVLLLLSRFSRLFRTGGDGA